MNKIALNVFGFMIILILYGCNQKKEVFIDGVFSRFDKLSINEITSFESKRGAVDKTPSNLVEIGEGIYPNTNKYILATPKTYQVFIEKDFGTEIRYFYSVKDSLLKVVLYEWSPKYNNMPKLFDLFQQKFQILTDRMTKELGNPIEINIEQNKNQDSTFRDDIRWKSNQGLNAYLYMFGRDNDNYREINLAIYKD